MGRKGAFAEKPKKGPGRKTKKQGPPVLSRGFKGKNIYILFCLKSMVSFGGNAIAVRFEKNRWIDHIVLTHNLKILIGIGIFCFQL